MYLVDTDVLVTGTPGQQERSAALVGWMETRSATLFLSAITVVEIRHSIARLERTGAMKRAARSIGWFKLVLHLYGD